MWTIIKEGYIRIIPAKFGHVHQQQRLKIAENVQAGLPPGLTKANWDDLWLLYLLENNEGDYLSHDMWFPTMWYFEV